VAAVRAAILVTGDEILRGRIREANAGILARSLEERGIEIDHVEIVGDALDPLVAALGRLLASGVDLVCVTGGLGPTHDDLSMEAVGRATGRPLAVDAGALEMVRARSLALTRAPAVQRAVQEKQASLPAGAAVLPPAGTAPGAVLEHEGVVVVVLPGPPWELESMWEAALAAQPALAALVDRAGDAHERVLRIHAVPESLLVAEIDGLARDVWDRLTVGICAREGELEVTIRADPADAWAADALEERVAGALGDALFSRDGATVDEVVARALVAARQTVAVAESCTGGGLGARLTARPGSSAYVLGGVIAYADAAKTALLDVDPQLLRRHGAVSAECAEAMAEGARRRLGSDWALSITGVAGPGGGTEDKPVGLVYVGVSGPSRTAHIRFDRSFGGREGIRARAVASALHLLRTELAGGRPG
jgi:nicotinamide-nucleotide amidase